jgi:hypothetical protein
MRSLRHDSLVDTNNMQLKMYDAIKGAWGLWTYRLQLRSSCP